MSLYVWKSPVLEDTDEAKRLVLLFVGGFVTLMSVWLFVALAHQAWLARRGRLS